LGLTPLPAQILVLLSGIVVTYVIAAELLKHWFYQHFHDKD
jgi:hypothetical protein